MFSMPVIDVKATGANIKAIMKMKGFKIADVQARCGFNTPQAIFKWLRGDAVPTIDNMIIIADMFGVTIDQIVIIKKI
jgi:transcriptional regulator with XRE-family HTH domain